MEAHGSDSKKQKSAGDRVEAKPNQRTSPKREPPREQLRDRKYDYENTGELRSTSVDRGLPTEHPAEWKGTGDESTSLEPEGSIEQQSGLNAHEKSMGRLRSTSVSPRIPTEYRRNQDCAGDTPGARLGHRTSAEHQESNIEQYQGLEPEFETTEKLSDTPPDAEESAEYRKDGNRDEKDAETQGITSDAELEPHGEESGIKVNLGGDQDMGVESRIEEYEVDTSPDELFELEPEQAGLSAAGLELPLHRSHRGAPQFDGDFHVNRFVTSGSSQFETLRHLRAFPSGGSYPDPWHSGRPNVLFGSFGSYHDEARDDLGRYGPDMSDTISEGPRGVDEEHESRATPRVGFGGRL